jgi:hypothetical protein
VGASRAVRRAVSPGGFGPLFFECSGEHWNKGGDGNGYLDHGCVVGGRMAVALRLIAWLAMLCSCPAWAVLDSGDVGTQLKTQYKIGWPGLSEPAYFPDVGSACMAAFPHYYNPATNSGGAPTDDGGCTIVFPGGDVRVYVYASPVTADACPDGSPGAVGKSSDGSTVCHCTSGFTTGPGNVGGSCRESTDADCPSAGTDVGGADKVLPRQPGGGSCVGGCVIRGSGSVTSGGQSVSYGPYQSTGKACSSSNSTSPVTGTAAGCAKQGMGSGQVNGTTVCVPATSTSTTKTSSTTSTSASGVSSGSQTTTETTDNHDGSTTTTTTTTRSDGSSRTTTTTGPTPAPGSASGSGPAASGSQSSSFGGTCATTFACDGDAVQCAIAKDQHQRNCSFFEPTGPEVDRFTNARTEGDSPPWSPTNVANVDSTTIDFASGIKTDKHFGSGCVEDQVVPITTFHTAVIIRWSDWCSQMQMIGKLMLAVSWLLCAGIVFKQ